MFSRVFLLLTGLLAGLWLRTTVTLDADWARWLPWLALLTLVLAVVGPPRPSDDGARARMEDAYRRWLDAWHHVSTAPDHERYAAEQALTSAGHLVVLTADDRVVKSLRAAADQHFTPAAVAQLVLDMRRSLRRAGVTLRVADIEAMLSAGRHASSAPRAMGVATPTSASFLT